MWKHQHAIVASAVLGVTLLGAGVGLAVNEGDPPTSRPVRPDKPQAQTISGEVQGYNLDPRGNYNGVILKEGDHTVQFNFRPDAASTVTAAAPVGKKVQLCGEPESRTSDRTTYRLVNIIGDDGKKTAVSGPDAGQTMHAEGTVKQLNYTPRGEVDGVILDTGDFVHVDPRSAATLNLSVGQKITAEGRGHAMTGGHNVIEADQVNGQTIEHPKRGPGGPDGPRDADHPGHGPHDRRGPGMDGPSGQDGPQDDGAPPPPPGQ